MVRELGISLYLFVFRILFNLFKLCPQRKKTVSVASFGDNIFYTARSLRELSDEDIIILKGSSCRYEFDPSIGYVVPFDLKRPIAYLQSIYHLATATTILVDTYYGFLAAAKFKKGTNCVQLWHAAGAIKQFGLLDPSIENRTPNAKDRFQKVYDNFHYCVAGSEKMATIFKKSFGLTDDRIIRTGTPRTDILFDSGKQQHIYQDLVNKYPAIKGKKIMLYAPTFRANQLSNIQFELDIKKLYEQLSDDYALLVKAHPAVNFTLSDAYKDFAFDVSDVKDTNSLLLVVDLLITDYSSIPFEYALLEKPMIFFAYDMEEYEITSGLMPDFENQMPGPVVFSTEAIIRAVKQNAFDKKQIQAFAAKWNEYSDGKASLKLAKVLLGIEEKEKAAVSNKLSQQVQIGDTK